MAEGDGFPPQHDPATTESPASTWVDLLDPGADKVVSGFRRPVHPKALEWLTTPTDPDREARPRLEPYGDHVVGQFVVATVVPHEDRVFYQEVGLLLAHDVAVTVRKSPNSISKTGSVDPPFDPAKLREASSEGHNLPAGMVAFNVLSQIAEYYVDLVEKLQDEIDEAEDGVEQRDPEEVRTRLADLRSDLLHVRRILFPTRDAVRRILDERVDTAGDELFTDAVEFELRDVYDDLLRAADGLDAAREMLASVRDYLQAKVANDQNDVMKRLTVLASILLLPTLIVGFYGQNFDSVPELHWGVWWSWALIGVTTVGQLIFFKRLGWIGRVHKSTRHRRRWGGASSLTRVANPAIQSIGKQIARVSPRRNTPNDHTN